MTLAVVARTPVPRAPGNLKRGRAAKAPAKAAKPASASSIKAPVAVKVAAGVAPVVPAKVKADGPPKAVSAHPGYAKMVHEALKHLQDRKGSSRQAILKYIMANFTVGNDQKPVNNHLKKALVGGTKNGNLKNVGQGKGASGLFKLPEKLTQEAPAPKPKVPARKRAADSQTAAPQAKKAKVTKAPASTTRTSPASAAKKPAKATKVTTSPPDAAKNVEAEVSQAQPQASTPKQMAPKKRWGQRQQTQPTKPAPAPKALARSAQSVNSVAQAAPSTPVPAPAPTAAPVAKNQPRSRTQPAVGQRASKVPQPPRARGKPAKPQVAQPQGVEAVEASTPTPVPQPSRAKAAAHPAQPQGQRSQGRRGAQEAPVPAPQTAPLPQSTGLFGREAVNGAAIQSPAMKAIRRSRWGQGPTEQNQNQENQGPVFGPIPKPADYVEQPEAHQPGPVYGPAPRPAGYTDAA